MNRNDKFVLELGILLDGCRVIEVKTGVDTEESICNLTVERGGVRKTFDLHATDLGAWVGPVKVVSCGRELYEDFSKLVEDLATYLLRRYPDHQEGDPVAAVLVPVEDVRRRCLGFKCRSTGHEWWASLVTIKNSPWGKYMGSPENRMRVAQCIYQNPLPRPEMMVP